MYGGFTGHRLKRLIVVDPEYTGGQGRALGNESSGLRWKVSCARVPECPVGLETVKIRGAHPAGYAIQLRVVPSDRECDRGIQERAEVVRVVRVFPGIICVYQHELTNGLLETCVELIAEAWLDSHRVRAEYVLRQAPHSCCI